MFSNGTLIKGMAQSECVCVCVVKVHFSVSKYSTSNEHLVQYNLASSSLFISYRAVST